MVRLLTEKDAPAYRELRLEALRLVPDAFCSDYKTESQKPELFLEKCLKEKTEIPFVFGAFVGKELVGITGFAGDEIIQIYMSEKHRRKGLAHEMVLAAVDHAFSQVKLLLYVNVAVVLAETNAKRFYESLGFEPTRMDTYTHNGFGIQLMSLSRSRNR
jgi:RimJ/RimL family protein N-acetyltransferase